MHACMPGQGKELQGKVLTHLCHVAKHYEQVTDFNLSTMRMELEGAGAAAPNNPRWQAPEASRDPLRWCSAIVEGCSACLPQWQTAYLLFSSLPTVSERERAAPAQTGCRSSGPRASAKPAMCTHSGSSCKQAGNSMSWRVRMHSEY